ncbi:MAG: translation initiation factor IF-2 N-terminal domain-containing protein [Phycisphaerales bacterium]|nr:translation initiation factor IF-2 N-terminal domain-containing protein [Phycisphaerales bacterium]
MTKAKSSGGKKTKGNPMKEIMVINDDPGVETRIAILEDGRLEELYTERINSATGVGNIYKGRVTNVEPAIQAAFIEYGGAQSGFLHVTDLHPKYFPGKETSERVGKKIAKHNRPPIQKCVKRGDEILIQVLKEGIGTKGPTLTSYLSIPGRLAVMMPYMDKVGVSRKIEDEDDRREMRKILDSINLPDGFGFILRTAGLGKKQVEIKRDIAYLMRLWKMIEKRISTIGAPCQLYNESDLLVRTIRDVLRKSIGAIVVDSESSYERISAFLKIAAPRSSRKVVLYRDSSPIFHAFDIERQIEEVHSREVILPSGGRLVIDQTEALVAIDVNSGKSRGARNSEANALNTNLEAANEICRQLRLRDLGGIVINDLIDMGKHANRKKVEQKFSDNLERDRARSTVLPISRFGLLEMTRQRIRPSVLDSHYIGCAHCTGLGRVKTTEEVAADATRHCGWLLQHSEIHRVEFTCSTEVGTYLLSNKRTEIDRYEKNLNKRIVVRICEGVAADRVSYYAYDARGSDIDLSTLPASDIPTIDALIKAEGEYVNPEPEADSKQKGKRRSRRRRNKNVPLAEASSVTTDSKLDKEIAELDAPNKKPAKKKKIKKATRKDSPAEKATRVYQFARSVGKSSKEVIDLCESQGENIRGHMSKMTDELITKIKAEIGESETSSNTNRHRRRKGGRKKQAGKKVPSNKGTVETEKVSIKKKSKKKRSRRRTKKGQKKTGSTKTTAEDPKIETKPVKVRRTLYGGSRRSVTTDEVQQSMVDRS